MQHVLICEVLCSIQNSNLMGRLNTDSSVSLNSNKHSYSLLSAQYDQVIQFIQFHLFCTHPDQEANA